MTDTTSAGRVERAAVRFAAPLCAAPFLFGLWGLLRKGGGSALLDFNAVACAGDAWLHGVSLYAEGAACPFGPRMPYVYPPPLAEITGTLQRSYGLSFELILAGAIFGVGLAAVLRDLLGGPREALAFRAPFFCALTARALFSGNVSLLFHAAIFLVAAHAGLDLLLLALVAGCAICKPTFATYAALFLFLDRPWKERLGLAAACFAATAAYFAAFRAFDAAEFEAWLDAVRPMSVAHSGHSFLALLAGLGLSDLARAALYAVFAAALLVAGGLARRRLGGDRRDGVWLGIAVCVLLNPRLMYYDHLTLPFGMGVISQHLASALAPRRVVLSALLALWVAVIAFAGVRGGEILFLSCLALIAACAFAPEPRRERSAELQLSLRPGAQNPGTSHQFTGSYAEGRRSRDRFRWRDCRT